jgi:hypothetical protein
MDEQARPLSLALTRIAPWAGPLSIAAAGIVMLVWTWGHWPDVLIDFGRELYVPWRITEGAVLYRDISYFNGPLSPYLNSLWFAIFGVGLRSLAICNIAIVALLVWLLYRMLARISGPFPATLACLVFVTLFAFGQLDTIGNYNYVSPYSHEVTHGLLLSFLALTAFSAHRERGDAAFAAAGCALGLVFLTKTEIFLAAGAALGAGLILHLWAQGAKPSAALRSVAALAGCALLGPGVALLLLSTAMPFETALAGILDPFASAFNPEVTSLRFYRWGMGTLFLSESLEKFGRWTALYAALFVPAAMLALALRKPGWHNWAVAAGLAAAVLAFVSIDPLPHWTHAVRPLPLLLVLLGAGCFAMFLRELRRGEDSGSSVLRLVLIVFSLVLLAKIILNVRLMHYGFALAMPGVMILIVALTGWIPAAIRAHHGFAPAFLAVSLATLLVAEFALLRVVDLRLGRHLHTVASGVDAFHAGARAPYVSRVLADLASRTSPEDTLAVLPEGIMINYLSRRANPTPFTNFMPPELMLYGEDRILDAFRSAPPDYVLVVHKFTGEYGFPYFGQDYGKALYYWVTKHYEPVQLYGQPPLQHISSFGIQVLRRIEGGREERG